MTPDSKSSPNLVSKNAIYPAVGSLQVSFCPDRHVVQASIASRSPNQHSSLQRYQLHVRRVSIGKSKPRGAEADVLLVDWVFSHWNRGEILEARDISLGADYVAEEVELVMKLGLLCSNSDPAARPSMRQVVQFLEGDVSLPELPLAFAVSYPAAPTDEAFMHLSSVTESVLSGGR